MASVASGSGSSALLRAAAATTTTSSSSRVGASQATRWTLRWFTDELSALARAGNWEGAVGMFRQMYDARLLQPNVFHYTTVITACGRAGQLATALSFLEHMKAQHVQPNVYTYTALLHACAHAPQHADTALRLFAEMRLRDVTPNVKTMTALAAACAREARWQRALRVLDECDELRIAPNVFTCTAVMDACRRAGVCAPVLSLLRTRMRGDGITGGSVRPNAVTYNTALAACAAARDVRALLRVYARMAADGYRPTPYTRTILVDAFRDDAVLAGSADDLRVRARHAATTTTTAAAVEIDDDDATTIAEGSSDQHHDTSSRDTQRGHSESGNDAGRTATTAATVRPRYAAYVPDSDPLTALRAVQEGNDGGDNEAEAATTTVTRVQDSDEDDDDDEVAATTTTTTGTVVHK